jgi:hypothetical protein
MCGAVTGLEKAVAIEQREHILLDVPLRVAAGAWDEVTTVCLMAQLSQSYGDRLAFLAGNKDLHKSLPQPTTALVAGGARQLFSLS